jgi:predicted dinucleotide-binding enzyme
VLIIGGAGRVGSAVAIHLLSEFGFQGPLDVTIAGRRPAARMSSAVDEITHVCTHTFQACAIEIC